MEIVWKFAWVKDKMKKGFISARKSDVLWIIYKALVNFTDNFIGIVICQHKRLQ